MLCSHPKIHHEKRFTTRIQSERRRHLKVIDNETQQTLGREIQMTKFASFTAAFVLFAPIAAAILLQAAQIVS